MATLTKADIAALSVDERFALVDEIYDSFRGDEDGLEPPDWHKKLLDQRLAEAERSPEAGIPWEVVRAEMMKKWVR
jgi:putative addiction module component (TIGR02574 family)